MGRSSSVLIVGAGHAGGRVADHLRALGCARPITLIGAEPHLPYERPQLSKDLLLGKAAPDDLALKSARHWHDTGVDLLLNATVGEVDRSLSEVVLRDGRRLGFKTLVVASGADARQLPIPGADHPRVVTVRTLDDAVALRDCFGGIRTMAVIGAGVIGLEVAAAASQSGIGVTLIESSFRVMARSVPRAVSTWLQHLHELSGTKFLFGVRVGEIIDTKVGVKVRGANSEASTVEVTADLVLVATGSVVRTNHLENSGLPLGDGMIVDACCRSPVDAHCYAAGDVAHTFNPLYGRNIRLETWRNAENQARAVAEFICGRDESFVEIPWMWTDQLGRNIQVVGFPDETCSHVVRGEPEEGAFSVLWLKDRVVWGGVLVDNGRDRRFLEMLVAKRIPVDPARIADVSIPLRSLL